MQLAAASAPLAFSSRARFQNPRCPVRPAGEPCALCPEPHPATQIQDERGAAEGAAQEGGGPPGTGPAASGPPCRPGSVWVALEHCLPPHPQTPGQGCSAHCCGWTGRAGVRETRKPMSQGHGWGCPLNPERGLKDISKGSPDRPDQVSKQRGKNTQAGLKPRPKRGNECAWTPPLVVAEWT